MAVPTDDGTLLVGDGDGSDLHPVGAFPAPAGWSPDGSTFVFVRDGDVWLADADGSGVRNLSRFDLGGASGAWWSPDGRSIAVLQGQTMWIMSSDGSERVRIGSDLGPGDMSWDGGWVPAWSRDGAWLAIPHGDQVTLVHPSDRRVVRLEHAWHPVWSRDSRHLAIASDGPGGREVVDVTNPDGSGRVTLREGVRPIDWVS